MNKDIKYMLNKESSNVIIPNGTTLVIYRENLLLKKKIKDLLKEIRLLEEKLDSLSPKK